MSIWEGEVGERLEKRSESQVLEEEEISQDLLSLCVIEGPLIRFFWSIHWALCSLATGNLAGLAAAWQQASRQEWTTAATAIHLLEGGWILSVPGLALIALALGSWALGNTGSWLVTCWALTCPRQSQNWKCQEISMQNFSSSGELESWFILVVCTIMLHFGGPKRKAYFLEPRITII